MDLAAAATGLVLVLALVLAERRRTLAVAAALGAAGLTPPVGRALAARIGGTGAGQAKAPIDGGGPVNQTARTVGALLALGVVAAVVPMLDQVRQGRAVAWAVGRGAVQLGAVGLVLGAVFRAPLAVLPVLAVMIVAATTTVTSRLADVPIKGRRRLAAAVVTAVVTGAAVTGTIVFGIGALPFDARNLVAYGGITIGGAMTASTLTGRRFTAELTARRLEIEGRFALGATARQATADAVSIAVGEALVPALDQTRTTGLVTLPGAFVGALIGGASPLAAARFQLVVLVGLLAAESVAAVMLLRLLADVPYLPGEPASR